MIKIFLTLFLFSFSTVYAATCTTTSRSNYTTGQVLTSAALNADLNQLVTKANAMDAKCLIDGTVGFAALNATEFETIVNGIQSGCKISYSDANTISVGKCIATVNGYSIRTTIATTVTWGGTSSVEAVSKTYYVYIKTGSTGTTLNLQMTTTVPNEDGYDSSGNKAIGSFYNNAASAIDSSSLKQWLVNSLMTTTDVLTVPGGGKPVLVSALVSDAGVVSAEDEDFMNGNFVVSGTSIYTGTFVSSYWRTSPHCWLAAYGTTVIASYSSALESTSSSVYLLQNQGGVETASAFKYFCKGNKN